MHVAANMVMESAGTAAIAANASIPLGGAITGYAAFSSAANAGDTVHYLVRGVDIVGRPTGQWEAGRGTLVKTGAAWTLARNSVESNSSGTTARISFSSGDKMVQLAQLAPTSEQIRADLLAGLGISLTGMRAEFAGAAVPAGWLETGAAKLGNRAQHAALFARIGTLFGPGDGATTFGLPSDSASKPNHVACIKL